MAQLRTVDKCTVTFLVDNNIEWFTKLPPGFTHEMRQHLAEHNPPIDDVTGAPIMDFENYSCGAHGFSALIETQVNGEEPHYTLFDTGPESRSIARNVAAMQVETHRVDRVVLSHWHSDHSGGILSFLKARAQSAHANDAAPCVVDLHPDRPIARGIGAQGRMVAQLTRDPTFEQIREVGGVVETHAEGHAVAGGTAWVSGEIPRVTDFEDGLLGAVRWFIKDGGKGEWVSEEHIMDERYAAVNVAGKGLVVFSACSHAGIVNVVKDAVAQFSRPIYMIIGGLHLAPPDLVPRIEPTVNFLANQLRPAPTFVLPMHCTGFGAKIALEAALGEGCVPAGVGHKFVVEGDREVDKLIFPPSIE